MTEFTVRHMLLKRGGKIRSRRFRAGGYEHYKIRLFVEGPIDTLDSVQYRLHDTFSEPIRLVEDSANGFAMDIWTWGEFQIQVTLNKHDEEPETLTYDLAFSHELPASDSAYTSEGVQEGAAV